MSAAVKRQRLSAGSAASSSATAASAATPARPPSLSDATIRAALRPGQFVVLGGEATDTGDVEYTLHRLTSLSSSGAVLVEYDPDAAQSQQKAAVHCDWSERICLPVRAALLSGSTVYALYYLAEGAPPTSVYYRAEVQPLPKGKSGKARDRQVLFGDGVLQTPPHTVEWEGVQLPGVMTVSHSVNTPQTRCHLQPSVGSPACTALAATPHSSALLQSVSLPVSGRQPVALTAQLVQSVLASSSSTSALSSHPPPSASGILSTPSAVSRHIANSPGTLQSATAAASALADLSYNPTTDAAATTHRTAIAATANTATATFSSNDRHTHSHGSTGSIDALSAAVANSSSSHTSLKHSRPTTTLLPHSESASTSTPPQPPDDIHIPVLSPSASLLAFNALSPHDTASTPLQQQQGAVAARRKRSFYIAEPAGSHNTYTDEPALQPIDIADSGGGRQQQQKQQHAAADSDWRVRHYVSLLGCVHEWGDLRMLRGKQLIVAPYVLLSC